MCGWISRTFKNIECITPKDFFSPVIEGSNRLLPNFPVSFLPPNPTNTTKSPIPTPLAKVHSPPSSNTLNLKSDHSFLSRDPVRIVDESTTSCYSSTLPVPLSVVFTVVRDVRKCRDTLLQLLSGTDEARSTVHRTLYRSNRFTSEKSEVSYWLISKSQLVYPIFYISIIKGKH